MVLDHLNNLKNQLWLTRALDHLNDVSTLTTDGSLEGQLSLFLLTCQVSNLSPRTIADYSQKIGAFVRFCRGQGITKPLEVEANHVRFFLLSLQNRCKPISVKDYYGHINRFFNWQIEEGTLKENPMARMRPPRVPKELVQPFTPQNIAVLLAFCGNNFLGIRNRAIILTFLDTGLRLSELANIQLSDMDFERETIKVMGKGAKERVVRIGKETQKAVLSYLLQRTDNLPCLWVTEERKPLHALSVQTMIKRLGKRAGFKNVRCSPHTFRHTFGTSAIKNGANVFEVQSLLGHSTLTMTRRYAATIDSEEAVKHHRDFSPVDRMMSR